MKSTREPKSVPTLFGVIRKDILDKKWIFLVGRPYTLFGASLYQRWFDPPQIIELFGASIPDNLYIEEHPNVVRRYVIKGQLDDFSSIIRNIVMQDREKAKKMLVKGLQLSAEARAYIQKSPFSQLQPAVDFLVKLALHATVFSYFAYPIAKEQNDGEIIRLAEQLRAVSYYPKVVEKVINPLAKKKAGDDFNLMTIAEAIAGDKSPVAARKEAYRQNKRLVYAKISGKETVQYVDNVMKIIELLERVRISDSVRGQVGYPGKVTGRVRLILTSDTNVEFDKGDILVAVTSNPKLMPLIHKCGAIVTDEGGITCHAAIVSRELKKPCVIGTRFATHTFRDGDLVEVDAERGVVRLLKKRRRADKQQPF